MTDSDQNQLERQFLPRLSIDVQRQIGLVAQDTLTIFEEVSQAADIAIVNSPTNPFVWSSTSPWHTGTNMDEVTTENRSSLERLRDEPAIARIVCTDSNGVRQTYFFCRKTPMVVIQGSNVHLVSYRSPVGRLAALGIGEELDLTADVLRVAERATLVPVLVGDEWDSQHSTLQSETYGPLTVYSLRHLLPTDEASSDLLSQLLEEESTSVDVTHGIRRNILTRMELRDQPILDKIQDRIFRLPLIGKRLFLLGPPGTGKTTTLIRRLGQKLDVNWLEKRERVVIQNLSQNSNTPHEISWLMFTPTTLLQQYVKESFAREGIPASDRQVCTWDTYRKEYARRTLGLLRRGDKKRGFVLREQSGIGHLKDEVENELTTWFDDFEEWQHTDFADRLRVHAERLAKTGTERTSEFGELLAELLAEFLSLDKTIDVSDLVESRRLKNVDVQGLESQLTKEIQTFVSDTLRRPEKAKFDFPNEMQDAVRKLAISIGTSELGKELSEFLSTDKTVEISRLFDRCRLKYEDVQALVKQLTKEIDMVVRGALTRQVNLNYGFLDEMVDVVAKIANSIETSGDDWTKQDEEDEEDEQQEGEVISKIGRREALEAFNRASLAQARARVSRRAMRKGSADERLLEWIGNRGLSMEEQTQVGQSALLRTSLRQFLNPVRSYINGLSARYRRYRRERQSEGRWYHDVSGSKANDLHPLELDILLLSVLRTAKAVLASAVVRNSLQHRFWSALRVVHDSFRNQILVDEATDFSPVQIACMSALSNPGTQSFFACGDFNQRLTVWGAQSESQIGWADDKVEIENVNIGYRQSRELNALARVMERIISGSEQNMPFAENGDREGVSPILVEKMPNVDRTCQWLADRIVEIEKLVAQLPSIAILVTSEDQVVPVAEATHSALSENNISVVACHKGQAIGQDNDVRVFAVEHIKGLEFEAVFFVDIDRLAEELPDLFSKFLYVGASRAATYLGLTCSKDLPSEISELRPMFSSDWNEAIA